MKKRTCTIRWLLTINKKKTFKFLHYQLLRQKRAWLTPESNQNACTSDACIITKYTLETQATAWFFSWPYPYPCRLDEKNPWKMLKHLSWIPFWHLGWGTIFLYFFCTKRIALWLRKQQTNDLDGQSEYCEGRRAHCSELRRRFHPDQNSSLSHIFWDTPELFPSWSLGVHERDQRVTCISYTEFRNSALSCLESRHKEAITIFLNECISYRQRCFHPPYLPHPSTYYSCGWIGAA